MSHHVPTTAGVLTIIGGVFILLGGLVIASLGAFISFLFPGLGAILVAGGLGVGILTLLMGVLMFVMPQNKTIWGALTIVLAVVSLPFGLGGFIIGFILALIGGILAITYKSAAPPPAYMGMPPPPPPPPQ
ncbi:MAG TPA: DUF6114 domain-containing protein [Thermoplasmata archaeon]|nr:DUF6114 domain-containing protein [Thermoplasmata archaeon]HEV2429501.1 DUF6114 domain-containing protein [Thermoplasmata archaeon]